GLAGPVAGVGGVGEEVDELDGVVLTLLGDAGGDAQACAAGRAGALTGGVRQGCHSPVEGGGRLDGGQAAGGLDAGTDDAGGELVGDVGGDGGPALVDGGLEPLDGADGLRGGQAGFPTLGVVAAEGPHRTLEGPGQGVDCVAPAEGVSGVHGLLDLRAPLAELPPGLRAAV